MPSWETLPDILRQHGGSSAFIEYIEGQSDRRQVSYAETMANALGVLHHFQAAGMRPGDRVILFTPSTEQFVDGFWACQLGGLVPVPVAVGISDDHRYKLLKIFSLLGNAWVYTDEARMTRLADFGGSAGVKSEIDALLRRCFPVERIDSVTTPGDVHATRPDELALIQFSSGSTSDPKGVQLTHANLLTNIGDISSRSELREDDCMLSWMPLTHDMGLIGMYLSAVAVGVNGAIMDTQLFTRRPLLWLEEANRLGATLLSSPNFGYKHVLKVFRSKGLDGIRLDRVRLIYNGAEPILPEVCREFLTAMADFGLRPEAMYPVYGLAEASLAVTIPVPGRAFPTLSVNRRRLGIGDTVALLEDDDADAIELVGCGSPLEHCECRIANDSGDVLADGIVGRIQIRGGNVTAGYLDPQGNIEQAFTADGWLDTGDLGFFRDGDLYVCGRSKEILFANGENYYPHDLEALVAQQGATELGKIAIAAVRDPDAHDDREQVVAFLLHRGSPEDFVELSRQVRRTLVEQTGIELDRCVPVRNVPKTTSGKLQRRKLAAAYLAGEFSSDLEAADAAVDAAAIPASASASEIEQQLLDICAEVIVDRQVGVDDDLFDAGVNSLALVEIHERLEEQFPGRVEVEDLFERPSVRALADWLSNNQQRDRRQAN
jgi:acyl-CoA synthetase (AMP-forming)/AMP-acid ligase II/acyl carrier protein